MDRQWKQRGEMMPERGMKKRLRELDMADIGMRDREDPGKGRFQGAGEGLTGVSEDVDDHHLNENPVKKDGKQRGYPAADVQAHRKRPDGDDEEEDSLDEFVDMRAPRVQLARKPKAFLDKQRELRSKTDDPATLLMMDYLDLHFEEICRRLQKIYKSLRTGAKE